MDETTKTTIAKLFNFEETIIKKEHLNVLLNTKPPQYWIKTHPHIKDWKYLPIDKVEYLLRKCFKTYNIEVKENKPVFNSIVITVRVHYLDPSSMKMEYHDGVGACELQTIRESGALKPDMSNISRGAVQMAVPIAKSMAIKDACDHFGELFGASLNRKDVIQFTGDTETLNKYSV